jgi:hypothetical protein
MGQAGATGWAGTEALTGDTKQANVVGTISAALPLVGAVISETAPKIADWLQKATLRLTPAQQRDLGSKVDNVVQFLNENKVSGTPEARTQQISDIYNGMEDKIQSFLTTNEQAGNITIPKEQLRQQLESLKIRYTFADKADLEAAGSQIDQAVKRLDVYGDNIPVSRLDNLKRDIFKSAWNKAGTKVLDWVEQDVANTYRGAIVDATKGLTIDGVPIDSFWKQYSTVITAKSLLKIAATRSETGFLGKLISGGVGVALGSIFGPVGEVVGAGAGLTGAKYAATPLQSSAASTLGGVADYTQNAASPIGKIIFGGK